MWLEPNDWKHIQNSVPIACVDVLPLRVSSQDGGALPALGLIRRSTPHQGEKWCLVGGRMLRDEALFEAVARQLHETLGDAIRFAVRKEMQPAFVAQYFRTPRGEGGLDPRQHAIGLTFCVPIEGPAHPQGEAVSFAWFDPDDLPLAEEFGFGQERVVGACLSALAGGRERRNGPTSLPADLAGLRR